jgi:hypothetical protein
MTDPIPEWPNPWDYLNAPEPEVPTSLDGRVNYVIDHWDVWCDAPLAVYAETLWPAALDLFVGLMTFGMDDVIRGYARPKNLRSRSHGKRSNRGRRRPRLGLPELGDEIGSRLPGARDMHNRKVTDGVRNLWLFDSALQRGLYYYMLADLGTEFAANWTSLLYDTQHCQKALHGRLHAYNNWESILAVGGVSPCMMPIILEQQNGVEWRRSTGSFSPKQWTFTWFGTARNTHNDRETDFSVGLKYPSAGSPVKNIRRIPALGPKEERDFIVTASFPGASFVQCLMHTTYGTTEIHEPTVIAHAPPPQSD